MVCGRGSNQEIDQNDRKENEMSNGIFSISVDGINFVPGGQIKIDSEMAIIKAIKKMENGQYDMLIKWVNGIEQHAIINSGEPQIISYK